MNNYKKEVAERFGNTEAYKEYESKTADYTEYKWQDAANEMNTILEKFAKCKDSVCTPDSSEALSLVKELQSYISENCYTCTNQILASLGQMYVADDRFKNNIDSHGTGTADFISKAIEHYCR